MPGSIFARNAVPSVVIEYRIPLLVLLVAAAAIPVELRPFSTQSIDSGLQVFDIVVNIAAFFAVGFVLGEFGLARAVLGSAAVSLLAETAQFFIVYRTPSAVDLATNIGGGLLGALWARRWPLRLLVLNITPFRGLLAIVAAIGLIAWVRFNTGPPVSARGFTEPGVLEAHWRFDEENSSVVPDASGHGLQGTHHGHPTSTAGVLGRALQFNGANDWVDFKNISTFRLAGSMTICAWIKSTAYPRDDAAIVSAFYEYGYQLDTTVDSGPRTIGFKLADACGKLMARYGATPLELNTWYHLSGVYDAQAKSLAVYLNGRLDNGSLTGVVSAAQRSFPRHPSVGHRPGLPGFEFAGLIDDGRIYSTALTEKEIGAVMRGGDINLSAPPRRSFGMAGPPLGQIPCRAYSDRNDARLSGVAALLGALVAVAGSGLIRRVPPWLCFVASVLAGVVLVAYAPPHLPSFNRWLLPLMSLVGAASIMVSRSDVSRSSGSTRLVASATDQTFQGNREISS